MSDSSPNSLPSLYHRVCDFHVLAVTLFTFYIEYRLEMAVWATIPYAAAFFWFGQVFDSFRPLPQANSYLIDGHLTLKFRCGLPSAKV